MLTQIMQKNPMELKHFPSYIFKAPQLDTLN